MKIVSTSLAFLIATATICIAQIELPSTQAEWEKQRDKSLAALKDVTFSGWPATPPPLNEKIVFEERKNGVELRAVDFDSEDGVRLRLFVSHYPGLSSPDLVVLNVLNEEGWTDFLAAMRPGFEKQLGDVELPEADEESFKQTKGMYRSFKWAMAYIAPRGVGLTKAKETDLEIERRLITKGQTLDGMRVWDVQRAVQVLRSAGKMKDVPLWMQAQGRMADITLFASLFVPKITRLDLYDVSQSLGDKDGASFWSIDGRIQMPQAVAMSLERNRVILYDEEERDWSFPSSLAKKLEWKNQLQNREPPQESQSSSKSDDQE